MAASFLLGLLLAALSAIAPPRLRRPAVLRRIPPVAGTLVLCVALCALLAAHLHLVTEVAERITALSPQAHRLPIPAVGMGFLFHTDIDPTRATLLELVDAAQALCLLLLAGVLRSGPRASRLLDILLSVTAVAMALLALRAPGMESSDLYSYVGLAQAAPTPYHPDAIPLAGENAVVNAVWGLPLAPSPYGPLWWLISRPLVAPGASLLGEMLAFRAVEIVALAILLASLAALGCSRRTIALLAVNPGIHTMFIAEGHNDLLAASLLFAAATARRRSALLAVLLAAGAGAIKLPFLLPAFLVFLPEPTLLRRILLGSAATLTTLLATQLTAGTAYWQALRRVVELYPSHPTPMESALQALLALIALGAVAWALLARRVLPGAVWAFPALGHFPLPQYLAWSFPAALLGRRPQIVFLAALPLTIYMLNIDNALTPLFLATRALLAIIPTALLVRALLARSKRSNA